ncbi:hypothetical protein BpHYR1_025191 [Brachionus plicatilis]|uniref:Uncharacterized protein n=1 Tax=Brachionus plicatilis TaxID=10195 RepID=A0A3M7SVH1_BRAPC|nr:hypothetical protein BpHYR1_025191 [Brachionus plicatilis]
MHKLNRCMITKRSFKKISRSIALRHFVLIQKSLLLNKLNSIHIVTNSFHDLEISRSINIFMLWNALKRPDLDVSSNLANVLIDALQYHEKLLNI